MFCIGFHKTGTTSLDVALTMLGYRVTGPNWVMDADIRSTALEKALALVPHFDAFQDNPWPVLYREMDVVFPGSKFILTVRDTDKWLKSAVDHFGTAVTPMREWIYGVGYGSPVGNEARYAQRIESHNAEVRAYFCDRDQDFLVMDITKGDGWEKLCPFLGLRTLREPFPKANTATEMRWVERR